MPTKTGNSLVVFNLQDESEIPELASAFRAAALHIEQLRFEKCLPPPDKK